MKNVQEVAKKLRRTAVDRLRHENASLRKSLEQARAAAADGEAAQDRTRRAESESGRLRARVEELESALRDIADRSVAYSQEAWVMKNVAKKALGRSRRVQL